MSAATGKNRAAAAPFPWDAVVHAGLCLLRLPARDFWAMTPREIRAALGGLRPDAGPIDRQALQTLMTAFPDRRNPEGHET